ncbi:PEP-CTERM sorting domain-containing protein [Cerasicoccus maritimus]|uniref:PEP-CTERM sorting domain-containing protein n=1 Tax=Cerasicoccus maritimus TaxID=490089 RepID=UPI002852C864|nr:PEP-CTERM sorting domain-containing protein [Cerasicoccus maritimus]
MKNILLLAAAALAAPLASAGLLQLDPITGSFDTGPLAGTGITGFIVVEDNGLTSGTADTNPLTINDGTIEDLGFQFTTTELVYFDLYDDLDPFITYDMGMITGIDYFGSSFDGSFLDITYDAYQPDLASGIAIQFEDSLGNISTGTLSLPVNVPEPSTYALMVGLATLTLAYVRRRK